MSKSARIVRLVSSSQASPASRSVSLVVCSLRTVSGIEGSRDTPSVTACCRVIVNDPLFAFTTSGGAARVVRPESSAAAGSVTLTVSGAPIS